MKLVLGAGTRHKKGWTHHDIQSLEGISIVCDFWDLPKHVKPNEVTDLETTHFLEHIPMAQTHGALLLINGLMQPGGFLYIEVPNFLWHASGVVMNPGDREMVKYAFGGQLNAWDYHYNGFTPITLREDLEDAGFEITELLPNSSLECWAVKK